MSIYKYKFIVFLVLIGLVLGCDQRSPEGIFVAIFDKKPKSLKLIEGQDQYLFDCCLWLHF